MLCLSGAELRAQIGAIEDRFGCQAERIQQGLATNDHLGHSLAAGDWNGDGIDDLLAGNFTSVVDPLDPEKGVAWLFLGHASNPSQVVPALTILNIPVVDDAPVPVEFIGDINNDGADDIAIGGPGKYEHWPGQNGGEVAIFLGDVNVPAVNYVPETLQFTQADIVLTPPMGTIATGDEPHFGFSVANVGDIDDNGWPDLVVGAPGPVRQVRANLQPGDPGFVPSVPGRAFLFLGSDPTTWTQYNEFGAGIEIPNGNAGLRLQDRFGWSVEALGDIDGDLVDDFAVGAIWASFGINGVALAPEPGMTGEVSLYFGGKDSSDNLDLSGPVTIVPQVIPGSGVDPVQDPRVFGFSLAGGVDFTGDLRPDLLVGCPSYSANGEEQGAVYAYSVDDSRVVTPAFDSNLQPIALDVGIIPFDDPVHITPGSLLGWSIDSVGQYNPNGNPTNPIEFVVGALKSHNRPDTLTCDPLVQGGGESGRVFVISVTPGLAPFYTVECLYMGESATKSRLGTSVVCGDFDGDDELDIAAAGSGYGLGAEELGRLYIFSNGVAP